MSRSTGTDSDSYKIAREKFERKRERLGQPCPKCGHLNFPRDPICRRCMTVVNQRMLLIAGAIGVLIPLTLLLWFIL